MPTMISYTIKASFSDVRRYKVIDQVCSGVVVFDDFLADGESRTVNSCADSPGGNDGRITHQRSDGPLVATDVSNGDTVDLS